MFELSSHILLPEPRLSFHSDRNTDRDIHPLRGLIRFGPYSRSIIPDPIRIATIAPSNGAKLLYNLLKDLSSTFDARERKEYLPRWPGFKEVFGVRYVAAAKECLIELDDDVDAQVVSGPQSHVTAADQLVRAMQRIETRRSDFDVLFIFLPGRWEQAFESRDDEDFDLHDFLKASAAVRGIPIQIVREDKAATYPCRASVMWRIGLATYVKAGGIPWKLADVEAEAAYIGISYALRTASTSQPKFVTCCSQVFDADGSGLEFVAFDANEVSVHRHNPYLSRTEMFRVISRSMDLYRRRHAGRSPRRVMVHKTTDFRSDEVDGCMEALQLCETVDLVQIVDDVVTRGVRLNYDHELKKGVPAPYPVERGTLLGIGQREALLWTHGDVAGIIDGKPYFQGARGTPRPIRLVRHAGHGSWDDTARAVLSLTKMDWNNDAVYDPLPVTIGYAKVLARVVKRMPSLGTAPYQFRFFM